MCVAWSTKYVIVACSSRAYQLVGSAEFVIKLNKYKMDARGITSG